MSRRLSRFDWTFGHGSKGKKTRGPRLSSPVPSQMGSTIPSISNPKRQQIISSSTNIPEDCWQLAVEELRHDPKMKEYQAEIEEAEREGCGDYATQLLSRLRQWERKGSFTSKKRVHDSAKWIKSFEDIVKDPLPGPAKMCLTCFGALVKV